MSLFFSRIAAPFVVWRIPWCLLLLLLQLVSIVEIKLIRKKKLADQLDPDGICGRHLQIMVRTRGLGRAFGRVIGRALGREDHHDSDDAPQRRRPTTSARRQRGAVSVAEDDPVVAADEPMVDADTGADVHPPGVDASANEPEGFPVSVWNEEERSELKLSFHGRKVQKLGRPAPQIKGLVVATGLSPLIACSVDTAIGDLYPRLWRGGIGKLAVSIFPWGRSPERQTWPRQHIVMDHTYAYLGYEIYIRADCWIYEHFSSVAECIANPDYDEVSPRTCRWIATNATVKSISTATYRQHLDRLMIPDVYWMPYGENRAV
ncbi:hypothetical protein HKD37_08G023472 [Glycine soja]